MRLPSRCLSSIAGADLRGQMCGVAHMQAFDGQLQMLLPRKVPASAFAPDVVV